MDHIVVIISLSLLKLPFLLRELLVSEGVYKFISFAVLVPFWVVILNNLLIKPVLRKSKFVLVSEKFPLLLLFCFIGLILTAISRAFFSEITSVYHLVQWLTIMFFSVAAFLVPRNEQELYRLLIGIFHALGFFVALNVALFYAGVSEPITGEVATLLSIMGIEASRQSLPLITGINSSGLVAGASLAAGGVLLVQAKTKSSVKLMALGITGFSFYVLLVADSRIALLSALLAIAIVGFAPVTILRRLPWSVLVMPLLPLLAFKLGAFLAGTEIGMQLSRSTADWFTLNQRNIIMGAAWRELSNFSLLHLIGFGSYGQVVSGVIGEYINIFAVEGYHTVHNVVLQYILDIGYLGLIIFLTLLFVSLRRLVHFCEYTVRCEWTALLSFMVYFILVGTTEAIPTMYQQELFIVFLFIVISSLRPVFRR